MQSSAMTQNEQSINMILLKICILLIILAWSFLRVVDLLELAKELVLRDTVEFCKRFQLVWQSFHLGNIIRALLMGIKRKLKIYLNGSIWIP